LTNNIKQNAKELRTFEESLPPPEKFSTLFMKKKVDPDIDENQKKMDALKK
jgi:hypothetical protein